MDLFFELVSNRTLVAAVTGWFVAQILKTIIDLVLYKSFHPERLVGSGGMPSSHSATVCALTSMAFLDYGASSFEFAVSFIVAIVVMHDATGVRMETGKQSMVLNALLRDNPFEWKDEVLDQRLKELVGHTPLQVAAGAVLGVAMALLLWFGVYESV